MKFAVKQHCGFWIRDKNRWMSRCCSAWLMFNWKFALGGVFTHKYPKIESAQNYHNEIEERCGEEAIIIRINWWKPLEQERRPKITSCHQATKHWHLQKCVTKSAQFVFQSRFLSPCDKTFLKVISKAKTVWSLTSADTFQVTKRSN